MGTPSDEYPRIYRNAHLVGGLAAYAARLKGELRRADVELKEPEAQSEAILRRREYYATLLAHVEAVGVSLDPDAQWSEIAPLVTAPPYRTDRGELVIEILRFLKSRSQPATVNEVQAHLVNAFSLEFADNKERRRHRAVVTVALHDMCNAFPDVIRCTERLEAGQFDREQRWYFSR